MGAWQHEGLQAVCGWRWQLACLIAMTLLLTACGNGDGISGVIFVPAVSASGQGQARLATQIHYPEGLGPFPVAVLLHGSSGGNRAHSDAWRPESRFLTDHGFAVIAFMRRGRGESTGRSAESELRNCREGAWDQGLAEAQADIDAIIGYATTLDRLDASRIVLWGVSRGGFLAVRYAASGKYRANIRQVVNFVGGWVAQAEDQCEQDFNLLEFAKLGAQTRTPMLWLYGEGDRFYGAQAPAEYVRAFRAAGGNAGFLQVPGIPENGHWLPQYPGHWQKAVADFLVAGPAGN